MSTSPNTKEQTASITALMAAEVEFLTAFGWTPVSVRTRYWGTVVQYVSPTNGVQMNLWDAVARQKASVNYATK